MLPNFSLEMILASSFQGCCRGVILSFLFLMLSVKTFVFVWLLLPHYSQSSMMLADVGEVSFIGLGIWGPFQSENSYLSCLGNFLRLFI